MGYDWSGAAEGGNAEKMTNGYHYARVDRVVMGKKSGPFISKNKDPQIMIVFFDDIDNAEATSMLTLSEKAGWTVARLLSRLGVDLEQMKKDNVEPRHFANEKLAQSYFVGKSCWIKVEPDGEYQKVTPLKPEEVPEAVRRAQEVDDPANPFA